MFIEEVNAFPIFSALIINDHLSVSLLHTLLPWRFGFASGANDAKYFHSRAENSQNT